MADKKIEMASWNRYLTTNLAVEPGLLGLSHAFNFEGLTVVIVLPTADRISEGEHRGERLSFNSWREVDGKKVSLQYEIHSVDVVLNAGEIVSVPEESLTRPLKEPELFSEQEQERFDKLTKSYGEIAERAFDLWIRTLRWNCDNSAIGQPEVPTFNPRRGPSILRFYR